MPLLPYRTRGSLAGIAAAQASGPGDGFFPQAWPASCATPGRGLPGRPSRRSANPTGPSCRRTGTARGLRARSAAGWAGPTITPMPHPAGRGSLPLHG